MRIAKVELTEDELRALVAQLNRGEEYVGPVLDAWEKLERALVHLDSSGTRRAKATVSR